MHNIRKKFRILALSTLFPSRAYPNFGIFVLNRLKAIHRYHDISVIAPVPTFPFKSRFRRFRNFDAIPAREEIDGLEVEHPHFFTIPHYFKWTDAVFLFLSTLRTISRLSKRNKFDLIDVHWSYPEILTAFIWTRFLGNRFIVTIRGKETLYSLERSLRKYIIEVLLRRADAVITLSTELKELVMSIGVAKEKIHVVPNGVDISRFYRIDQQECRKRVGIKEGKKVILSAGSLILRKGHHNIIELLPIISKKYDLELYVIGSPSPEGDDRGFLENMVRRLRLDNVHFVGNVPNKDLVYWYNASDIFCLPSTGEGCPNVVLEALSCGTPVIASNVGDVNNIIDSKLKGFVFDLEKPGELENCLDRAFECQWDREAISASMQERTWDMCAKYIDSIYKKVLEG